MPGPIVTLLTDFGLASTSVAAMKGVILGVNPEANLVDLTHGVPPRDILQGAFLLSTGWPYFPSGTIHLAVVDPGVGTERKALLLQAHGHFFLAPDNGLLSFVLPQEEVASPPFQPYRSRPPQGFEAYALTNPRYWQHPVSTTFHGRDIFAPVAAHLSLGVAPGEMGEPADALTWLAIPVPYWQGDRLLGHVLHIDWFGNLVTSVPEEALPASHEGLEVELRGTKVRGLASTYAAGGGLAALIGSHGYLEVALTNGDAARSLGVKVGDEVVVRKV